MPYLDLAVVVALLGTLLLAFLTRRRSPLVVSVAAIIALSLLVVAFVIEGARWQLIALALAAPLVAGMALWARGGRARGWARAGGVGLAIGLVGLGGVAWALPPVFVPPPSGAHPVGAASTVWVDGSRDERGGTGGEGHRSIPATIWYPAAEVADAGGYLPDPAQGEQLASALAAQYGMPPLLFDGLVRAKGNAVWNARAAEGRFPVVIASPGTSSSRWLMRSWAEEVASHGAVVIALDHPYDSALAELDDGRTVHGDLITTGDDARDQELADGWAGIRAADLRAVIGEIAGGRKTLPALSGADPDLVIAAGHSLGGAAAVEAARGDERIRGVIDIDGMPRSPEGTMLDRPTVFVVAGDADPNPRYRDAVSGYLADETAARVTLDGVAHVGLVDSALLLAPIPGITGSRGAEGPRLAARAAQVVIDAVRTGRGLDPAALAAVGTVG